MAHTVRKAYKVWLGIAAGVFCLVAIIDVSSSHTNTATSAPVASSAPAAATTTTTVAPATTPASTIRTSKVTNVAAPWQFTLADHTVVVLDDIRSARKTDNSCQQRVGLSAAKKLLLGKTVSITPVTYEGVDPRVSLSPNGDDYATELSARTFQADSDCLPATSSTSSEDIPDVNVDVDHHLPDGALTGGYCRHKWWC